jgi:xanthosine utilization system XapX-like protein
MQDFAIGLGAGLLFGLGFAMFVIKQEAREMASLAKRVGFFEAWFEVERAAADHKASHAA